jgi:hydrogenase nickel incorporation protein HypB
MCKECGCKPVSFHTKHNHEHGHSHERVTMRIDVPVLSENDLIAERNRALFTKNKLYAINLISSPGSGKTTIVEYLARHYKEKMALIVGDIQTQRDADRARIAGCQAVQIETLGACHLDANSIESAFSKLDITNTQFLVIENVGNLVCPSSYDLGEHEKIAVLSLPEGDDKILKYPSLFHRANMVLLNKIDLEGIVHFDKVKVKEECRILNSDVTIIEIASGKGTNMNMFIDYLDRKMNLLCK